MNAQARYAQVNMFTNVSKKITPLAGGVIIAIVSFWILLVAIYLPTYHLYLDYKQYNVQDIHESTQYIKSVIDPELAFEEDYDYTFMGHYERANKKVKKMFVVKSEGNDFKTVYETPRDTLPYKLPYKVPQDLLQKFIESRETSSVSTQYLEYNKPFQVSLYLIHNSKGQKGIAGYIVHVGKQSNYTDEMMTMLNFSIIFCLVFSVILGKVTQVSMNRLEDNQKYISELETTDIKTGITTKNHFLKIAQKELTSSIRYTYPVSAIIIKVNDLIDEPSDRVNELLNELIHILHNTVRSKDILATWDEHSFVVLCPYTTSANCKGFANRVERSVQKNTSISCSYGIAAHAPSRDMCIAGLMNRAGIALKETQLPGKSNIESV